MAEDQKDRYIQYLAERNLDLRSPEKAMRLVLEDFVAKQEKLEDKMAAFMSEQTSIKEELLAERKMRKSAELKQNLFRKSLIIPIRSVLATDGRKSEGKRLPEPLESWNRIGKMRKMIYHSVIAMVKLNGSSF